MQFRPTLHKDIDTLANICLKTAHNGDDATELLDNTAILTDLYITPYFYAHCGHCFTITNTSSDSDIRNNSNEITGYAVTAVDTIVYSHWLNQQWLSKLRLKYPRKKRYASLLEQSLFDAVHQVSEPSMFAKSYPSHAHLSLLPHAQKQGLGSAVLNRLYTLLSLDSTGLHVEVSQNNTRAIHFFIHNGFQVIEQNDTFLTLIRSFRQ